MKSIVNTLWACLLFAGIPLWAQPPPSDPIGDRFFPPELVMQHQQAIGLTEDQRSFLKSEILKAQPRFTELQWQLQAEVEKLVSLVQQTQVDERQTLAQLDKVLSLEREIKQTQFGLLVRIKNKLTPKQQAQLQEIKSNLRGK